MKLTLNEIFCVFQSLIFISETVTDFNRCWYQRSTQTFVSKILFMVHINIAP
jgi:hypothetical protein